MSFIKAVEIRMSKQVFAVGIKHTMSSTFLDKTQVRLRLFIIIIIIINVKIPCSEIAKYLLVRLH